jgi:hypothetical protein
MSAAKQLTERELKIRRRLRDDFQHYASRCLVIRNKTGKHVPFRLNKAQQYLHEKAEEQLVRTGKVRINILKGRQQGISTYVEGRLYWRTTHRKGARAFILTHEEEATKNLFEMASRFHENNNPLVRPHTGATNAKELIFDALDSGYRVGTAGNKAVGRSSTIQFFHGSEVAFWPHAEEHAKGIMQAIPDEDDTEAFRESTANGVGNYFHQQWKAAERGESEYENVFIPWFWQDEYRKMVDNFEPTDEEIGLSENYGLDNQQLAWRRQKILDLSTNGADGEAAFKQEYPCNAAEAFQMTGKLGLITPVTVVKARKAVVNGNGPLIVGIDDSRGGDRFSAIKRQGRKAYSLISKSGDEVDKLGKRVAICKEILDEMCPVACKKPDMMFIDAGGGADLVDRLHELGYEKRVKAISFGSTPLDPKRWPYKRDEMWGLMNEWLTDENLEVDIPDSDSLQADLCASLYTRDAHDRIKLLSKDKIKAELGFSTDEGDALALTFAEPVKKAREEAPKPNLKYIV